MSASTVRPENLSDPAGIATELAGEALEDVTDGVKDAAERLRYEEYMLEHSSGMGGNVARFARERPVYALLIAAAAGLSIGYLWRFR